MGLVYVEICCDFPQPQKFVYQSRRRNFSPQIFKLLDPGSEVTKGLDSLSKPTVAALKTGDYAA